MLNILNHLYYLGRRKNYFITLNSYKLNMKIIISWIISETKVFLYLFLAALGLHCCARAPCSRGERGPLPVAVCGPLPGVASPAAEHGFQARGPQQLRLVGSRVQDQQLWCTGSVVVAHGLSCSTACGIFPDQGSNPRPLHWQADSQPLCHQGSPRNFFFFFLFSVTGQKDR